MAAPLITVRPTKGGVPNSDDDGRQRERYLHPRFRIDSNEANRSHIGYPYKPSRQTEHEKIEFTPEGDGKTRRQILSSLSIPDAMKSFAGQEFSVQLSFKLLIFIP